MARHARADAGALLLSTRQSHDRKEPEMPPRGVKSPKRKRQYEKIKKSEQDTCRKG
jgi:hypothetical protein